MELRKPPDHIWLQYNGDANPADYPDWQDGPYPDSSDISWCHEPIFDHDIKYVRAERIEELEAELEQCLDCCKRVGELDRKIAELESQTQADIQTMLDKDERISKLEAENKKLRGG